MLRSLAQARPLGYQQHLAAAVDAGVNFTPPVGAVYAVFNCETQAIRWRDDGVNPTATIGQPLAVGVLYQTETSNLAAIRVISQTAGAIVNVTYYGLPN